MPEERGLAEGDGSEAKAMAARHPVSARDLAESSVPMESVSCGGRAPHNFCTVAGRNRWMGPGMLGQQEWCMWGRFGCPPQIGG